MVFVLWHTEVWIWACTAVSNLQKNLSCSMFSGNVDLTHSCVWLYSTCPKPKLFALWPVLGPVLPGITTWELSDVLWRHSPLKCLYHSMSPGGWSPHHEKRTMPWALCMFKTHGKLSSSSPGGIIYKNSSYSYSKITQTLLTRSVSRWISWHVKANRVNKAPQE